METQTPLDQLQVKIQSRNEVLYDGPARAVSSVNETGEFSILPYHANFISLLKTEIIVRDLENKEHKFEVDNGVLKVEENHIEVFLGVKIH